MIWNVWNEWLLCMTALIKLNSVIKLRMWSRNFVLYISYVDVLSIHNIDNLYIPNTYTNVWSIPYVDKLSIFHMDKNLVSLWGIETFYPRSIDKIFLFILGTDKIIFVYSWYRQFFYISYRQVVSMLYRKKVFVFTTCNFFCLCVV